MRLSFLFTLALALALVPAANLRADAPPATVRIQNTGADAEGLQTLRLEWDAISNATYLVQGADSLAPGSPWHTLDAVQFRDGAGSYAVRLVVTDSTGRSSSPQFYRLVQPQSEIFSVEPAVFPPGAPATVYVTGQCFENSDVVRVDGVVVGNVIYVSGGLLQCVLPPQSAGPHRVELVRGGVVRASFTVSNVGGATSGALALQGPPTMPPTSPSSGHLRKSKSNPSNNRMSGGGGIRENDTVTFDVQEGKKGLNAVNVKLARMAGGGGAAGGNVTEPVLFPGAPDKCGDAIASLMPFSGEVRQQVVDLAIEGRGLDVIWARTYNSRIGRSGTSTNGWTFSYDVTLQPLGGDVVIHDGTGRADTFKPDTNGVYTCPEFFSEGTLSNDTFTLTLAARDRYIFYPFRFGAQGVHLSQIIDRNGNTLSLGYDTSGHLTQIVDDLGRTNTVGYDTAGRLASVTDFSGRTVKYQYYQGLPGEQGGAGDLKSVTSPPVIGTPNKNDFPSGKTTTYTYSTGYLDQRENHLLLSVIDANGETARQHVYQHNQTDLEFLRCISVQHWTNTPTMISYLPQTPTPANQFATLRCIVNNPVGNVTECFFDARNRCVKLGEFTGYSIPGVAVSGTANRPTGHRRQEDTDVWWRTWSWNNDSLCTLAVGPGGQQVQCVYESDFDKSTRARKRADCRVVREIASGGGVDLDGDGTVDVTERVSRYEYDPRFGSDPTASRGGIEISRERHGDPWVTGAAVSSYNVRVVPWGAVRGSFNSVTGPREKRYRRVLLQQGLVAFPTTATDPRGIPTVCEYDAHGNRIRRLPGRTSYAAVTLEQSRAYNPYGQLTATTNAADARGYRRVDTFRYYASGPQAGYLQSCVVDAGGLALTENYEYDERGNLTRCSDPRGNDWLYTYNSLDQLVRTESASLNGGSTGTYRIQTQFSYDVNDNLTLVAEENRDATGTPGTPAFWRTQFVYDGGQRLAGCWRDKNGALVLRCTEVTYNAADQVVLYRSPEAVNGHDALNTVAFAYDERGLPYRTIAAPGSLVQSTTQWDYDANRNVTRVSEGLEGTPSITTMEYDGFAGSGRWTPVVPKPHEPVTHRMKVWQLMQGQSALAWVETVWNKQCVEKDTTVRLSQITDPMGNVTMFNHDANDNLKVVRHFGQLNDLPGSAGNIRLAESRYEYDGLDRHVRSRDSFFNLPSQANIGDGERTTTFAYAPNGECTSITDDLGRVTSFAYDTACRPSSVSSPGGKSVVAVLRDQAGNVMQTRQTDQPDLVGPPQLFAWSDVYDALNRRVSTTDNVGNTRLFAYDSRGNGVSTTDANGNETVYGFDGLSRQVSFAIAQGAASSGIVLGSGQSDYDDNDRCISSTDANGNVTIHAYDSLDRLTQTTQADGTHHALVWSPRGNLVQETDANGSVINHAYDLNGRCISNNITPGAGVASTTTFETFAYDGASRLVAAGNDASSIVIAYDTFNNPGPAIQDGHATTSTYDSLGNRLSLTYPGGRVLTYAYDLLDRCTNILETGSSLASFDYDGPARLAKISYANGMRTRISYDGISGTLNAPGDFGHGQISRIRHAVAGASPIVGEVTLGWDRNGNKIKRDDAIFQPAVPRTNSLMLHYDGADRLTEATVLRGSTLLRDTVYGLDRMGNRTNVTGAAGCSGPYVMDGFTPGPMDSQMNQYTRTPCDSRSYDGNGNLASRGSAAGPVTYQYDYAGRLVQVEAVDFSGGLAVITTSTYAYDALGRRVSKSVSSGGLPPVSTQFIYDGGGVIEERVNGAVAVSYVHATGLKEEIRENDTVVFEMRQGTHDYYYHTDDQGNVLALTAANGTVVERYDYDDYGKVTFLTSDGVTTTATSSAVGNAYCWQGLRLDAETGLQNNDGGCYLEPQTGQFTSRRGSSTRSADGLVFNVVNPRAARGSNPWSGGGKPLGYALNAHVAICQNVLERSKQSEAKSNSKAMFTAQKAFCAEKDRVASGEPSNSQNDVNR